LVGDLLLKCSLASEQELKVHLQLKRQMFWNLFTHKPGLHGENLLFGIYCRIQGITKGVDPCRAARVHRKVGFNSLRRHVVFPQLDMSQKHFMVPRRDVLYTNGWQLNLISTYNQLKTDQFWSFEDRVRFYIIVFLNFPWDIYCMYIAP
jgi:hypothetical protein